MILGFLMMFVLMSIKSIHRADAKISCGNSYHGMYKEYCYNFYGRFHRGFEEAEMFCQEQHLGGHLASIHSQEENDVFKNGDSSTDAIGLHKVNGNWEWSDGMPVSYLNWKDSQDDPDLIYAYLISHFYDDPGKWVKTRTFDHHHFWCKWLAKLDGCSLHIRDQCEDNREVLFEAESLDVANCYHFCNETFSTDCKSFKYDALEMTCTLYSDPVNDISLCKLIGGPFQPSVERCQLQGCQDFYSSSCKDDDLEPYNVLEGVNSAEACEEFCFQTFHKCAKWLLRGTTCNLYTRQSLCYAINGPKEGSLEDCS